MKLVPNYGDRKIVATDNPNCKGCRKELQNNEEVQYCPNDRYLWCMGCVENDRMKGAGKPSELRLTHPADVRWNCPDGHQDWRLTLKIEEVKEDGRKTTL